MWSTFTFKVQHDDTTDDLLAFHNFVESVDDEAVQMFEEVSYETEVDVP